VQVTVELRGEEGEELAALHKMREALKVIVADSW
jgi:hypothetical protein